MENGIIKDLRELFPNLLLDNETIPGLCVTGGDGTEDSPYELAQTGLLLSEVKSIVFESALNANKIIFVNINGEKVKFDPLTNRLK